MRYASLLLLAAVAFSACSSDAIDDGPSATIHPALATIGQVDYNTDRDPDTLSDAQKARLRDQRREALSAAIQIVKATPDWREASRDLEALATRPEHGEYVAQQMIAAIALQGVLLHAPDSDDANQAILRQVNRLVENDGVAFVAMVEGIDKARATLDAGTVEALEQRVVERYRVSEARGCDGCPAGAAEAMRQAAASEGGPSVLDRMPPAVRARALQAMERNRAARDRIRGWSS